MNNQTTKKPPGFDTIIERLLASNNPSALALAGSVARIRDAAQNVLSGNKGLEEEKRQNQIRRFIVKMAFNDGDMSKGYKDVIAIDKKTLEEMNDLGIPFFYSSDGIVAGVMVDSQKIPFVTPKGDLGTLFIYADPESGLFEYRLQKNKSRPAYKNAA